MFKRNLWKRENERKKGKNKKILIYYILITILCSVIVMLSLILKNNFRDYLKIYKEKSPNFRTLIVPFNYNYEDYGKNVLLGVDNILDVHNTKYDKIAVDSSFKNKYIDGEIKLLYSTIKTAPEVIIGRKFQQGDSKAIICPKNFYPDSLKDNKIIEKYFVNTEDILNQEFEIKYYTYDNEYNKNEASVHRKRLKLIGLYDNKSNALLNNECFILDEDFANIKDSMHESTEEFKSSLVDSFYVTVDKFENVEKVRKSIAFLGWREDNITLKASDKEITVLMKVCSSVVKMLLFMMMMFVILINTFYLRVNIKSEKKKNENLKECLKSTILINSIAFLIGIIVLLIIYLIVKSTVLSVYIYTGLVTLFNLEFFIESLAIMILIPILITIYVVGD